MITVKDIGTRIIKCGFFVGALLFYETTWTIAQVGAGAYDTLTGNNDLPTVQKVNQKFHSFMSRTVSKEEES